MRQQSTTSFVASRTLERRRKRARKIASFIITAVLVVVFPIYPASGEILYSKTGGALIRSIDESSILSRSENGEFDSQIEVSQSGFIDINIAVEEDRDWSIREGIYTYTVQSGDTINELAQDFGISPNTIKWNNALPRGYLQVDQRLIVLPEDGILYTVKKSDGIQKLASRYEIAESEIVRANDFESIVDLQVGQKIILPGAKPIIVEGARAGENAQCYTGPRGRRCSVDGTYQLKKVPGNRGFVPGHCTYFVAQYWPTNWRGHARYWFDNAKKAGFPTGQIARPGAIIVWYGPGYNLAYGHVGIVTQVNGDTMIVKDMNYAGLWVTTTRKESIHNKYIIGYIYQK